MIYVVAFNSLKADFIFIIRFENICFAAELKKIIEITSKIKQIISIIIIFMLSSCDLLFIFYI
ncbi:MAG: hypothetical protein QXQ30_01665 [Candidatus Pacearchaeota archaeon]